MHDEEEKAIVGDVVSIEYCGRVSKRKAFKLMEILYPAKKFVHPITGEMFTMPGAHLPLRDRMNIKLPSLDRTIIDRLEKELNL